MGAFHVDIRFQWKMLIFIDIQFLAFRDKSSGVETVHFQHLLNYTLDPGRKTTEVVRAICDDGVNDVALNAVN